MRRIGMLLTGVFCLAGCAHTPPTELVSARQTYQRVSAGPAARVVPADLHKAKTALYKAEQVFSDNPDDESVRDLAYVAERKAQTAEAIAQFQLDAQAKARAERELSNQQAKAAQATKRELTQTRAQLMQSEQARAQEAHQTEQERQARLAAESKAEQADQQAKDALSKLASVKEEDRGMVITLSGSVLFASNQAILLPEAQQRLNQVAEALLTTKERTLTIEGHTDSKGSDGRNLELSRQRAEAVRDYLVSRGYPADKILANGLGKVRPVADNATADGRANNRRVEIIVEGKGRAYSSRPHDNM